MNSLRSNLEKIPMIINSKLTLYDLLMYLYPEGYDTIIGIDEYGVSAGGMSPNKIQKEVLKIVKVCFPPNKAVYIPKDECMSYNRVELDRKTLYREFNEILSKFEDLETKYVISGACGEDSIENIQKSLIELDKKIYLQIGHIKNYKENIKTRDMDMFSNSRIKFIIEIYRKKIEIIQQSCVEIK
jgi:hypothetical protein